MMLRMAKMTSIATDWAVNASDDDDICWSVVPA
jgi:hypothetical protein